MILRWEYLYAVLLALAFLWLPAAGPVHAFAPDKGMFLVAAEKLVDPRFHRGVILLIQHDAQGSAGLVINRTSSLALETILPEDSRLIGQGVTLSYGGPVEAQTLLALVKVRNHQPEPADEVLGSIYVTGVGVLNEWPDFVTEVIAWRPFIGYTGWAPGQLDLEMQRGDWQVLPADEESVFAAGGEQLWESLHMQLTRQK